MRTTPFGSLYVVGRMNVKFKLKGAFSGLAHSSTFLCASISSEMEAPISRLHGVLAEAVEWTRRHEQLSLERRSAQVEPKRLHEALFVVPDKIGELQKLVLAVGDGFGFPTIEPRAKLPMNLPLP
jgi:hypothetical protein